MIGKGIKRNVTDALELPKEVMLNLPLLSLMGREELTIENYKGIMEYNEECIRVNTAAGIIKIQGKNLCLKQLTAECVVVSGKIIGMEYLV